MCLVDIRRNLCFQRSSQFQIEHRCVRLVEFFRKFGRFPVQIAGVTSHVTDDNGIEDRAERAKNEGGGKL